RVIENVVRGTKSRRPSFIYLLGRQQRALDLFLSARTSFGVRTVSCCGLRLALTVRSESYAPAESQTYSQLRRVIENVVRGTKSKIGRATYRLSRQQHALDGSLSAMTAFRVR